MKLAISNIAWKAEHDAEVFACLRDYDVKGIELAPTRLWSDWQVSPEQMAAYGNGLAEQSLICSSFQAILFNQPQLHLFGTPEQTLALLSHLKRVADLAAAIGAKNMVFGAPKQRDRRDLTLEQATARAIEVFSEIGEYCMSQQVCLCLEPNPTEYQCNFITDSLSGAALVRQVNSPGFRLHLDTAGMHLAGEDTGAAILNNVDVLAHIHLSEPYLGDFSAPHVAHHQVAEALAAIDWQGWMAIEMRSTATPVQSVQQALEFVQKTYGRLL